MALGSRSALALIAAASLALLCGFEYTADTLGGTSVRGLAQKHWWKQRQQWRRRHERYERFLEQGNGLRYTQLPKQPKRVAKLQVKAAGQQHEVQSLGQHDVRSVSTIYLDAPHVDGLDVAANSAKGGQCVDTDVTLHTAAWGAEIGLRIDGTAIVPQGSLANDHEFLFTVCLSGGEHTAKLEDSYGDGWHGAYVTINGVDYGKEFVTGSSEFHSFTISSSCINTILTVTTATRGNEIGLKIDGNVIFGMGTLQDNQVYTNTMCLATGTHEAEFEDVIGDGWHGAFLTIGGVDYGKGFLVGTAVRHTFSVSCVDTLMMITTATWGNEIGLKIDGNEVVAQGSLGNYQIYTFSVCLDPGNHEAKLLDSYGDGWHGGYLTIGGVDYGKEFLTGTMSTHTFLIGCIDTTLTITTMSWGTEIGLKVDGDDIVLPGALTDNMVSTYTLCLNPGVHEATLVDSYGDGWHHGYLTINGEYYGADFLTGTSMTSTFNVGGAVIPTTSTLPPTGALPPLQPSPSPEPDSPYLPFAPNAR